MTGNLVPEPRVNVLGHVVVKHVRTGSGSPDRKNKKLPAPQHQELPKAPLLNKSLRRITDGRVMLSSLNPEAATRVEALLARVKAENPTSRGRVEREISYAVLITDKKESRATFNNLAVFGDAVMRDTYNNIGSYVQGLQMCPEFAGMKDFLNNGTPAKREKAQALVRFASAFEGRQSVAREFIDFGREGEMFASFVHVKDAELRRLVMDYPQRADDIAEVIKSQHITDARHLREMIEHGEQALREGVL